MKKFLILLLLGLSLVISSCAREPENYTIYFHGNGGTPIIQSLPVTYGEYYDAGSIYVPTRYGYYFVGFYTTKYPTATQSYWDMRPRTYDIHGDLNLYAKWERW